MFETFIYSNDVEPETLLTLALNLASEGSSASQRDPETLCEAIRGLLDAFLTLSAGDGQEVETLDTERDILDLYQATYRKVYTFDCDPDNLWWNDYLPQTNVPKVFVSTVAKIEAGKDKAMLKRYRAEFAS